MIDLDKWQEIAATLGKNKLRTALTAFGVFWGIFMLVTLLAVGDAFHRGVTQSMSSFAPNGVYVWGERTSLAFRGLRPGREVEFDTDDIELLRRIPGVERLAPRLQLGGWHDGNNVTRGAKTGSFSVSGDSADFKYILRMKFLEGRFLDDLDQRERRKVCVIGEGVYKVLFQPGEAAVGQYVSVRGVFFRVVGVVRPFGKGDEVDRQAQTVFVPFTTFQQAFHQGNRVGWFAALADRRFPAAQVEQQMRTALATHHKVDPADAEAIGSFNMAKEAGKVTGLFLAIKILLWLVGVMTLLAGILGVSNIMLIAVKERTREIGVRKALGATPGAIIRMVLAETLALTTAAGYVGLLAAVALIAVAGPALDGAGPMVAPVCDFKVAITATTVLILGGALAGLIPARHAARIAPVEALRAE